MLAASWRCHRSILALSCKNDGKSVSDHVIEYIKRHRLKQSLHQCPLPSGRAQATVSIPNQHSESKKILPHPKQPEALEQSEPADEAALDPRGLAIDVEADESLDILTGVSTSFTGTIADDCSPSFEWITVSNARRASITESDHRKRCKTVLLRTAQTECLLPSSQNCYGEESGFRSSVLVTDNSRIVVLRLTDSLLSVTSKMRLQGPCDPRATSRPHSRPPTPTPKNSMQKQCGLCVAISAPTRR